MRQGARRRSGPTHGAAGLRVLVAAAAVLLLAELGVRVSSYLARLEPLERHPEVAARLAARGTMPPLAEQIMEPIAEFPARPARPQDDRPAPKTYRELTDRIVEDLPETPAADTIRVVILGDSRVEAISERVQTLIDERFGGRVEVLTVAERGAFVEALLVLTERLLPRWRPHLVHLHTGTNDLAVNVSLGRAVVNFGRGGALVTPDLRQPPRSHGLWDLVAARLFPSQPLTPKEAKWIEVTALRSSPSRLWILQRQLWELGGELVVSTVAAPDPARLSPDERDPFDTALRYLFPMLGDLDAYVRLLDRHNDEVRAFARLSGSGLVDAASALHGGRELFRDVDELTPEGKEAHARLVFATLLPRLERLVEENTLDPRGAAQPPALPLPPDGLPSAHPRDGTCMRGPCPEGSCFVPAGESRYGYPDEVIDDAIDRAREAYGFAERDSWYADEGPVNRVELSAFCIDEHEAARSEHTRCVDDGACPAMSYPSARLASAGGKVASDDSLPAVMPTLIDARAYCRWKGGRLPTDAEWDAAARGPEGRLLPWGSQWTGREANYCGGECFWAARGTPGDGFEESAPVDAFSSRSPYGAVGMAGNVWEWVADCFLADVHHHLPDGFRDPIMAPVPGRLECRGSLRGGSFASLSGFLERRTPEGMPDTDVPTRGVRCAYDFGTQHQSIW